MGVRFSQRNHFCPKTTPPFQQMIGTHFLRPILSLEFFFERKGKENYIFHYCLVNISFVECLCGSGAECVGVAWGYPGLLVPKWPKGLSDFSSFQLLNTVTCCSESTVVSVFLSLFYFQSQGGALVLLCVHDRPGVTPWSTSAVNVCLMFYAWIFLHFICLH